MGNRRPHTVGSEVTAKTQPHSGQGEHNSNSATQPNNIKLMHDRATAAYQTTSKALLQPGLGWPGLDLSHVRYEPSNQLLSMRLSS